MEELLLERNDTLRLRESELSDRVGEIRRLELDIEAKQVDIQQLQEDVGETASAPAQRKADLDRLAIEKSEVERILKTTSDRASINSQCLKDETEMRLRAQEECKAARKKRVDLQAKLNTVANERYALEQTSALQVKLESREKQELKELFVQNSDELLRSRNREAALSDQLATVSAHVRAIEDEELGVEISHSDGE